MISNKRIVQFLPTLLDKDATGNNTLLLCELLNRNNIDNCIVYINTLNIKNIISNHSKINKNDVIQFDAFKPTSRDIFIVQYGIAFYKLLDFIKFYPNKKILIYHNVTPSKFMYEPSMIKMINDSYNEIKNSTELFDLIYGDSEYNLRCLEKFGYKPGKKFPLLFEIKDTPFIRSAKNQNIHKTFIHVGRFSPNKKIEDVIKAYYAYKIEYNNDCSLHLVGKTSLENKYYCELLEFIKKFNIKDVYFDGMVDDNKLEELYDNADVYLCMSEHEGFCMPLIEAMKRNLLVCAYNSCAIPETMNGTGVLFLEKDYSKIASKINEVLSDNSLYQSLIEKEKERLLDFEYSKQEKYILSEVEKW